MRGEHAHEADGTITWNSSCLFCGQPSQVRGLNPLSVFLWQAGAFVHQAFPELPADDREILVSGTHGSCYDEAYPDDM